MNSKIVGLAYYQKKDWAKFLELIDDKESMHDSWKEWNKAYLKTKENLTSQGFTVKDCVVDLVELDIFCKIKGIKNDGKARSLFVSDKVSSHE